MTSEMEADIRRIKHELRDQGNMMKLMLFSQASSYTDTVVAKLLADPVLLELYRRVNAARTREDIVSQVISLKLPKGGRSSVYAKFADLVSLGVIELAAGSGAAGIFRKSAVDESLRIDSNPALVKALRSLPKLVDAPK